MPKRTWTIAEKTQLAELMKDQPQKYLPVAYYERFMNHFPGRSAHQIQSLWNKIRLEGITKADRLAAENEKLRAELAATKEKLKEFEPQPITYLAEVRIEVPPGTSIDDIEERFFRKFVGDGFDISFEEWR
jgi:hypothetical protein